MYTVMIRHYGERAQEVQSFRRKFKAEQFIRQQAIITAEGRQHGEVRGTKAYEIFDKDGTFRTTFWIVKQ
jgi:hypothetical protein